MSKPSKRSKPSRVFPPALACLLSILVAVAINLLLKPVAIAPQNTIRIAAGPVIVLMGAVLWLWAWRAFRSKGEVFAHKYTTETVITSGPYVFSRHPAYLAYMLLMVGIGLTTDNAWIFFLLPLFFLYADAVARREEYYLMAKHEGDYRPYRSEVRRWI